MSFVTATVSGIAGIMTGVVIGYVLWGHAAVGQEAALRQVTRELAVTKTWLWDEIRTSDARYERISSQLSKTLAALGKTRGELARVREAARTGADASPRSLSPPAGGSRTVDVPAGSPY